MRIAKSNPKNSRFICGGMRANFMYFLFIVQGHEKVKL